MLIRVFSFIKYNFRSFLIISFILAFSLISYSIFSFEFEKNNNLFLKRLAQKTQYYIVESFTNLAPYYEKIKSIRSIKSFYPYSYFYEDNNKVNVLDFELLIENNLDVICGQIDKDFNHKSYVIVGINFIKTNKKNPCYLLDSYLNIKGKKFKVIGIFKSSKNRFFNLRDDSMIISFNNYRLKNINNSVFYSFISEVSYESIDSFRKDLLKILPNVLINSPQCYISLNEIKARKNFFLFLKNKNFYFIFISSFVLGLMSFYLNRKFFMTLRIIGFNILDLFLMVFIFSVMVYLFSTFIYYIFIFLLNYILEFNLVFKNSILALACMMFFFSVSLSLFIHEKYLNR